MVVRRRQKRRRGERSYHGSHKKWRGGGSRGGRGRAGGHKHKYSYIVKYEPKHFGKRGFKRPEKILERMKAINLGNLERIALQQNKKEIDVKDLGFEKVMGAGKISSPLVVKAKSFSKSAIKRLEEAGGKAVKV